MTLKTIVQTTFQRVGLPAPDFVMASNDGGVRQVRALVNQEGKDLAQRHNWQALTVERRIVTRTQESQADAIPPDFNRFINGTIKNLSRNVSIDGPIDARDWQAYRSGGYMGPGLVYRVRGNALLLMPAPSEGETIMYEYVSKNWVDGGKMEMNADNDASLLDEELITLGCIWRYLCAIGNEYSQAFDDYEKRLANAIARDGAVRNLDFRRPVLRARRSVVIGSSPN